MSEHNETTINENLLKNVRLSLQLISESPTKDRNAFGGVDFESYRLRWKIYQTSYSHLMALEKFSNLTEEGSKIDTEFIKLNHTLFPYMPYDCDDVIRDYFKNHISWTSPGNPTCRIIFRQINIVKDLWKEKA